MTTGSGVGRVFRITFLVALLAIMAIGATMVTSAQPRAQGEIESIEVPRIEAWLDDDGTLTRVGVSSPALTAGLRLADLQAVGIDIAAPAVLDQATMQQLQDAEVDHLQLEYGPEGIDVYINAEPTVRLIVGEDEAAIEEGIEIARAFDIEVPFADLIPLVKRARADVVLYLPGAEEDGATTVRALGAPSDFTVPEATEEPDLVVRLNAQLDEQGNPHVLGMSPADIPGLDVEGLSVDPQVISRLQNAGVDNFGIEVGAEGVYFTTGDTRMIGLLIGSEEGLTTLGTVSQSFAGPSADELELLTIHRLVDINVRIDLP